MHQCYYLPRSVQQIQLRSVQTTEHKKLIVIRATMAKTPKNGFLFEVVEVLNTRRANLF